MLLARDLNSGSARAQLLLGAQRLDPGPPEPLLPARSEDTDAVIIMSLQGEETSPERCGCTHRGLARTVARKPWPRLLRLCPRSCGRQRPVGTALGSPAPAGQRGSMGLNPSGRDDPYVESVGHPRARQLKDARFHSRSIIPTCPRLWGRRTNACSVPTD